MITFLTHENFEEIAECLDTARLNRQRVEARILLEQLLRGVRTHPIHRMWENNLYSLARYGHVMSDTWRLRGYKDNQLPYFCQQLAVLPPCSAPQWASDTRLHESHRSVLIQKKPSHYKPLWPDTCEHLNYYYPTEGKFVLTVRNS